MKNVSVIVYDGHAGIVTLDSTVREKGMTVHIVGRNFTIGDTGTETVDRTRAKQAIFGNR